MILITGATGRLGRAVIARLLELVPASQIVAFVRDPHKAQQLSEAGVQVRQGSYDDVASLDAAMRGVEKVLLISGVDPDRVAQHQRVIDAAQRAGVSLIAYTSRSMSDTDQLANAMMNSHFDTEQRVKQSGLPYLIFRNALYTDVIPLYTGGAAAIERGIEVSAGAGRVAYALRREMGEGIANVLAQPVGESRTLAFTGSEAYSYDEVAQALSELTGRAVRYTPISAEAYMAQRRAAGLLERVVQLFAGFMEDIAQGREATVSGELEAALGRPPAGLVSGVAEVFALGT